jgi:hypothetical protein
MSNLIELELNKEKNIIIRENGKLIIQVCKDDHGNKLIKLSGV